ncbi:MAG: terpene cyclase/mutase family protein [Planctomycetes bacterium]|nr:terpene cyclase/mutase family protein [Planctomycetota bacterium]MCH9725172.1 terpene cyclase/mutase family protein [Planctomycetota bacterium]MCH9775375.1 terpene cyclase/mutase family protein [Planctomycetota bacterium]
MNSGRLRASDFSNHPVTGKETAPTFKIFPSTETAPFDHPEHLLKGIARSRDYLLSLQHNDGYWVGELEGDSILESEYILLLTFLGNQTSEDAIQAANYLMDTQMPDGGWNMYPEGPIEISASVKAYFALKLTGHDVDAEYMQRARLAILAAGGVEAVNSFTRYYLALLGVIPYAACPAVPPELMLIPRWMPFNIFEMSAWSRTILVPLSILWAYRPSITLPPEQGITELFNGDPEAYPKTMPKSETLDSLKQKTWLNWHRFFQIVDHGIKVAENLGLKPLRKKAVKKASQWMKDRFEQSDGLGAIFPPIIWTVIALKCLGEKESSPDIQRALLELKKLQIREGDRIRLQPCKSPVWDTALSTIALREAGISNRHPAIRKCVKWLLSQEARQTGDWVNSSKSKTPGGWYFEFNNEFYPDVDDTAMVIIALRRCMPKSLKNDQWMTDFLVTPEWNPYEEDLDTEAIVAGRSESREQAYADLELLRPMIGAIQRGIQWLLGMQNKDGGWGAFDRDNNRELFTQVPFADHNAMVDPSTADLTARVLETFADVQLPLSHPASQRAVEYVWSEQENDHCWYGRWGVNYLYGTWQAITGLTQIGIPADDPRIVRAVGWLKSKQQPSGGWGESADSYADPDLRGQGIVTPSQTAWALMGLMSAGEIDSAAVRRGIHFLLESQNTDGNWDEEPFTGTGFPKVFYLKYHLYRTYFPLMALARFERLRR